MKIITYETEPSLLRHELASDLERILHLANCDTQICIEPASEAIVDSLESWDGSPDSTARIFEMHGLEGEARVLVATTEYSRLFAIGKTALPHAHWGASFDSFISLDYAPDDARRFTQVHESLHFFGVNDCYNESPGFPPKSTCDNERCVMRYGNVSVDVCSEVLRQLRKG